eukprot:754971-Hanusia_phi.AAC.5
MPLPPSTVALTSSSVLDSSSLSSPSASCRFPRCTVNAGIPWGREWRGVGCRIIVPYVFREKVGWVEWVGQTSGRHLEGVVGERWGRRDERVRGGGRSLEERAERRRKDREEKWTEGKQIEKKKKEGEEKRASDPEKK